MGSFERAVGVIARSGALPGAKTTGDVGFAPGRGVLTLQWWASAAGSTSSTSTPPASLGWMKLTLLLLVPRLGAS